MKRTHIIALLIIAVAIGVIIAAAGNYSRYVNFEQAAKAGDKELHVVGQLAKDQEMHYDPLTDPNYFSFYLTDSEGQTEKVVFQGAKPQDFERSEQVVLTGKMEDEVFLASQILMKCPSKYVEDQVAVSTVK